MKDLKPSDQKKSKLVLLIPLYSQHKQNQIIIIVGGSLLKHTNKRQDNYPVYWENFLPGSFQQRINKLHIYFFYIYFTKKKQTNIDMAIVRSTQIY
jgi:hypothetical protein